jgi:hypothetical protein
MKTIKNLTYRPLRIALPGGKTLHLGPAQSAKVADAAIDRPALKKLLEAGEIEVEGGERSEGGGSGGGGDVGAATTHGHPQPTHVTPKGNR